MGSHRETFGEDPYLVSQLGVAAVRGLQGDTLPLADGKVFATLKLLTGHGSPKAAPMSAGQHFRAHAAREFFSAVRGNHSPHQRPRGDAVVQRDRRYTLTRHHWLLHDVLRGEWGFKGAVVSDYEGIENLMVVHHVAADLQTAGIMALNAGVDIDLPDGDAYHTLVDSVHQGKVSVTQIDTAVRRILELKVLAGLFEHPYADAAAADALTGNAEARAVALDAAHRTVVLLKNDGLLPLSVGPKTLAVIGPNAAVARLGGYSGEPRQAISALQGIRTKLGTREKVVYAEGVRITEDDDWWADQVKLADPAKNAQLIQEALKVAAGADEIVLLLGDTEQTSREGWADNHLGDRDSLDLVGQQNDLATAIFNLHKPTVVVLLNGRPPTVVNIAARANALIEGWYLGQEGGTALADVLFGDVNPGGKLPVTLARSVGQLPMFYNRKPSARRGYLFDTTEPLYPFGFGLSYTTFDIGAPHLSAPSIKTDGSVTVTAEVRNTGSRAGDEVVQLYIRDDVSSVTRPVEELKGFQRVTLAPGETKTVSFDVTPRSLQFWNADMHRVVEPGTFTLMVGSSSVDLKKTSLTVSN